MCEVKENGKLLVGNAFPMTLIRRHSVVVSELPVSRLVDEARQTQAVSFWGHENTRAVAEALLRVDLKPTSPRPAIVLDEAGYPTLDGERYTSCYVLSPDYRVGHRPAIGEEVSAEDIRSWHALKLTWTE